MLCIFVSCLLVCFYLVGFDLGEIEEEEKWQKRGLKRQEIHIKQWRQCDFFKEKNDLINVLRKEGTTDWKREVKNYHSLVQRC